MTLTARELNRATLGRQLLLEREPVDVVEATRRVVALQAQHPASPYIAFWNRVSSFDPADLDVAFNERKLVKATLMRFTLHVVHPDDHPMMNSAMQPSLRSRLVDSRFTNTGVTAQEADALVPDLLAFMDETRTLAEIESWLGAILGLPAKRVWWALRTYAPILHAPTRGPWSFGPRPSYVAGDKEPTPADRGLSDESLQALAWRYLEGFGPASANDLAQFALVQRSRSKPAVEAIANTLERLEGPDGAEFFDIPGGLRPSGDTPAPPRLLPMWDSVLLAHADKSRITPADYRPLIARSNGDVLPTLLVDGYVAGVWRPVDGGIEATAFRKLSAGEWKGLATEAQALIGLLADREPTVYRRYDRWWSNLTSFGTRVLRG